jgi:hypothetical protein
MSDDNQQPQRLTRAGDWAREKDTSFATCVKLPDGTMFHKFDRVGVYRIDVLPYVVGEGNPKYAPGQIAFERSYFSHRLSLPDGSVRPFLCLAGPGLGKLCPVCQHRAAMGNAEEFKELVQSLRPTARHLWNIVDLDAREYAIKVMDTNHYDKGSGFGEQMKLALQGTPQYEDFAELRGGYTLKLHVTEKNLGMRRGTYKAVVRIDFEKRDYDYNMDTLQQTICLDSCFIEKTYDELKRILFQVPEGEDFPDDGPDGASYHLPGRLPVRTVSRSVSAPPPGEATRPNGHAVQSPVVQRQSPRPASQPQAQPTPQAPGQLPPASRPVRQVNQAPQPEPGAPTADDLGMTDGMLVISKQHGECEIAGISRAGDLLTLQKLDGSLVRGVRPSEVQVVIQGEPAAQPVQEPAPAPVVAQEPAPAPVVAQEPAPPPAPRQLPASNRRPTRPQPTQPEPAQAQTTGDDSPLEPDGDDDDNTPPGRRPTRVPRT